MGLNSIGKQEEVRQAYFSLMLAAVLGAILLFAGCAWVKPTPEGENVRLMTAADVAKCEHIGKTTVSVLGAVAGVQRSQHKVQRELNTLARNSAAEMGGDTVVPLAPAEEGKQSFAVYRCMPR